MKLISCYVSSFGKLKDFSYDFSQGLNTIKQDNGWGKSTLATFIKAMFYGISSSKRSVAENERIKYKPWNSTEKFGGFIEFEWGDKTFKLERFFGSKESEDTVRLFDVQTGKAFSNTENLGERIFAIDQDGFLSTTYFSQKDFQIKSNTSLTAKFNDVCEVQDSQAFDKALINLEEKAKTYKYRGDKGLISDTKREIVQIDEQICQTQKSLEAVNLLKDETQTLEGQVLKLKNESTILTDKIAKVGNAQALKVKKENYEWLLNEKNQLSNKIKQLDYQLNGNAVNQSEINDYILTNNKLLGINNNIKILQDDISALNQIHDNQEKKPANGKNIFLILAVLLGVVGIGLFFVDHLIAIISVVLALVSGCLFLVSKKKVNDNENLEFNLLLSNKEKELNNLLNLKTQLIDEIDGYIARFNVDVNQDRFSILNAINNIHLERENYLKSALNIEEKLNDYNQNDINEFNKTIDKNEDLDLLKQKLSIVQNEFSRNSNELANKKASLNYHEVIANSVVDLESKKSDLITQLSVYEEEYQTLLTTIKFLKQADENLKVKYRAPLQQSLNKYLSYIDQKSSAKIDIDLKLTVSEVDGVKDTDYYSKGYQNLFDICKRFALTDVLFTKEKPFLILDDPFTNLDDEKIKKALELIKKLSEEYQIIYLVCHESRRG
ncbi:MAG: hypothetical protein E7348_03520 [Clostridiales bacterium]|nr:hypothetical protein [Clostridiales bacterium]